MKAFLLIAVGIFAAFLVFYWFIKKDPKTGNPAGWALVE